MTVYHYCGTDAFMSIVKEKELWLSSLQRMNDRLEGKVIEKAIGGHDWTYGFGSALFYICSFSAKGDETVQWMSYAHKGTGFSIGFDENLLWERRTPTQEIHGQIYNGFSSSEHDRTSELIFTPVVYLEDAIRSEMVDSVKSIYKSGEENSAPGRAYSTVESTVSPFRGLMKDPSFKHEQEHRLIYRARAEDHLKRKTDEAHNIYEPAQWRASPYGLIPYFCLKFAPEAITEIIVGPANVDTLDRDGNFVKAFLDSKGLEHVEVKFSKSPYRG